MTLKHSQFKALIRSLDALTDDQLTDLDAILHGLMESRVTVDACTVTTPATSNGHKSNKRNSGEWEEIKIIHGHQYRYRRFWEGGKLRSEYICKA